jgi:Flp pilus assembly protein TadB
MERQPGNRKAEQIDRLLYLCAGLGVVVGVFQWAEGHHLRAVLAVAVFLVIIPWLGKSWINRSQD